jgi:3-oxoadipate enol-lactonase
MLHFELFGDERAPRLLYINGSGSRLADIVPMLGPFAKRFRVLGFDHRGMGESSVPPNEYAMTDLADDVLALVDHVKWPRFRMFGISFGGMVAQHVAARVPSRIERMVLACTSSGGAGGSSYPLHELYALPDDERAERFPTILDTRFTPDFVANDEMARLLLSAPRPTLVGEAKRGLDLQMNARRRHDAFEQLPAITCPVMVAAGATDGIAPPENCRRLAEHLPDATYREFTGGHMFMLQDRSATPAMLDFLLG